MPSDARGGVFRTAQWNASAVIRLGTSHGLPPCPLGLWLAPDVELRRKDPLRLLHILLVCGRWAWAGQTLTAASWWLLMKNTPHTSPDTLDTHGGVGSHLLRVREPRVSKISQKIIVRRRCEFAPPHMSGRGHFLSGTFLTPSPTAVPYVLSPS